MRSKSTHLFLGIDIGKEGALVGITSDGDISANRMPLNKANEIALPELLEIFESYRDKYVNIHVGIEDVHSIFGASAKSNFQFGRALGLIEGYIGAKQLSFVKVAPKEWQSIAWLGIPKVLKQGKVKKVTDTKAMSLLACERLYPKYKLPCSPKAKKPYDGVADALLIAHYLFSRQIVKINA